MPASFSQGNSGNTGSGSSGSLAYPGTVAAGDTLVCFLRVGSAISSVSVSDNVNGAWVSTSYFEPTGGDTTIVGYLQNSASGTPTVTASWTGSATVRMIILDYTGVAASSLDQGPSNVVNGFDPSNTPSITTTQASEILVACLASNNGTFAWTSNAAGSNPSSGWVDRFQVDTGKLIASDVVVSGTGTYNAEWGSGFPDQTTNTILSFMSSGGITLTLSPGRLVFM